MSYQNRSFRQSPPNYNGGGVAAAQPPTITVMSSGDRFCTVNVYSDRAGNRVAMLSCCISKTVPGILTDNPHVAYFGTVEERAGMPVNDALKAAEAWLSGEAIGTGGL